MICYNRSQRVCDMTNYNKRLTVVYLQVYGSGTHFVLNVVEHWLKLFHILTHWELLGMRCAMCPVRRNDN
jgi:hypothetical protein